MLQFGAFFLYALIYSISAAPQRNTDKLLVLMDHTGCVNLLCEIQEYCDDTKPKLFQMKLGILEDGDTETDVVSYMERLCPMNTFTIMKSTKSVEKCGQKALVCNSAYAVSYHYVIELLKDPNARFKPKFVCGNKDGLITDELLE